MPFEYGTDLSCTDDFTEEGRMVSGIVLLAEALIRRWQTPRGMLLDDPNYGTDLREFLNDDVDTVSLLRIQSETVSEALKDERVVDCQVAESFYDRETGNLRMQLSIFVDEGLVRLAISVSDLTVDLLSVE